MKTEVERLKDQLDALTGLADKALDADDTTRYMSLVRLQGQVQKQLDEARLKSGETLDADALKEWEADFLNRMNDARKGVIEDAAWNTFVDKFLELGLANGY